MALTEGQGEEKAGEDNEGKPMPTGGKDVSRFLSFPLENSTFLQKRQFLFGRLWSLFTLKVKSKLLHLSDNVVDLI